MFRTLTLSLILALGPFPPLTAAESTEGKISKEAAQTAPLQMGDLIADGDLRTAEGKRVRLSDLVSEQAALLVFYRGGWCPYCNTHLGALQKAEKELKALGFKVLAVSPDDPEHLRETAAKNALPYTLLSDSSMGLAKKFGLAFQLDRGTLEKYKKWNIKLKNASGGRNKDLLPVPAAYLVASDGRILFSHHDPNYKERIDVKTLLKAAKKHRQGK